MANKKGDLGEIALIKELIKRDIIVSKPISDGNRYDLVSGNHQLKKIQVKEMWLDKRGCHRLPNYSQNSVGKKANIKKIYSKEEIDFIVGYVVDTDEFYIIPIEEMKGRVEIAIWHSSEPKKKCHQIDWKRFLNKFDLLK